MYLKYEKRNQFNSSVNHAINYGQCCNVYWNSSNSINQYQIIMRTEITDISKWLYMYNNPKSEQEFNRAFAYLKKVHDKYGTIDLSIIKSLIQ